MELPDLGEQCGVDTCKQLDFLPIRCADCGGVYCKHHSLPCYHACPAQETNKDQEGKEKGSITRHPCQVGGCRGGELTPIVCSKCGGNFCLAHRHQADHRCPGLTQPDTSKQEQAAAHIKALADNMVVGKKQGKKSEQLAAKVQLMKLKQKAIGDKNIPQQDRIYFLLLLPKSSSSSSSSIPVFVSQHWTIGRAIDDIATLAKLENKNNILGVPKLRLFHPSGSQLGPTDTVLQAVLGETVLSGQTVQMEYISEDMLSLS